MKFYITFLLIVFAFHLSPLKAQNDLFYINENQVSNLIKDNNISIITARNGISYRILRINLESSQNFVDISYTSKKSIIDFFHLPIVKTISNNYALDVIIPMKKDYYLKKGLNYFLIKINGKEPGSESINVNLKLSKQVISKKLNLVISKDGFSKSSLMNVWSYFDYNFLVRGVKSQVLRDLRSHNVKSIVIPPYVLPDVNNLKNEKIVQLNEYVKGANGFKYYLIYFGGFKNNKNEFLSKKWRENYKTWLLEIYKILKKNNIEEENIYLYPFDEPSGNNVQILKELVGFTKTIYPNAKFFGTISEMDATSSVKYLNIVQVHSDIPGLMEMVLNSNSNKSAIWLYETRFPNAVSNAPQKYINLAYKMIKYNIEGFGVWSYADAKHENSTVLDKGKASWDIVWKNNSKNFNNSLIYRKGNVVYSSLRWEALSYGNYEVFWFNLLKKKYGETRYLNYAKSLLNGSIDINAWEKFKLNLIN